MAKIIIISDPGDDGAGLSATTESEPTITIKVPGGVTDEQSAKIVKSVLKITGGEVLE